MPGKYRHVSLTSSRSIRVLHLEPSQDSEAPIQCSLKVISLDEYPKWDADYTALSYSWDAQRPSCEIACDGASLLITPNCEAAIRELRDTAETKILWIDSICIDQSHKAERNLQVALMGEIYKSATKVVAWLGESDSRVEKAIGHMVEISAIDGNENRRIAQRNLRERVRNIASRVTKRSEDPIGPLFERSWFHRMWTVQEVTISWVDRVYLRCGSMEVPWKNFLVAVDALQAEKYRWCCWRQAMSLQKELTIYLSVRRYEGAKEILDDNPGDLHNEPLAFSILINARRKQATEPVDMIFALYGLLSELKIPFPPPDYSKSVEDVYREAVISSINYDKDIHILYYAPSDHRRDGLASWVPDWGDDGWDEGDSRYAILRGRFAASGPGIPKWKFSENHSALILVGKIVDTVIFRADPLPSMDAVAEKFADGSMREEMASGRAWEEDFFRISNIHYSVLKTWVEISQWSDYPTGEPSKQALQRTLVNDNPECNAVAVENSSFDHWYDVMTLGELGTVERALNNHQLGHNIPREPNQRRAYLTALMNNNPNVHYSVHALRGPAFSFQSKAVAFSQKKCFFYTQNCYFGTAADPLPTPIQPDDKIAVVSGLEMPLLLRPVEGGYRLLTHVYVHGMMHGEVWPESDEDLEEIILL